MSSSPQQCWDRVETYANNVPTVVLIEAPEYIATTSGDRPRHASTIDFLEALTADIRGARYQKHVIPFTLLVSSPRSSQPLDPATATRHLGAGAADTLHSPLGHDDLGRLVGHVRERTRPPARLVGTQMAQNLVDSILAVNKPAKPCHRPDEAISQERAEFVQHAISDWHFPAHELDMDELTCATLYMLEHLLESPDLVEYQIPREELMGFLLATRRQYKHEREVHYHNWRHAVDVTQSIYSFLVLFGICPSTNSKYASTSAEGGIEQVLTPLNGLNLLVSAIGHDVGHPGVNNAFLVACNHPLAHMYNDKSVLENYHCAAYSQLIRRHWPKLATINGFRSTMISTILATDMQRHFDYMTQLGELKEKIHNSESAIDEWSDKDKEQSRETVMAILMKAADISNVARPFDVSSTWASILMNEFARQGELEAELDLPTCLFGGPPNKEDMLAAAQSQRGFMSLFGSPLFSGIVELMPRVKCALTTLEDNQDTWERKIQAEKQRRASEGRDAPLTFSSVGQDEVDQAQRNSEPTVVPMNAGDTPSSPVKRQTVRINESASAHPASDEKRKAAVGYSHQDDGYRASAPFLATPSSPLSPNSMSRRSSKDVALEKLQQLSMFANQGFNSDSRRGSADLHFNQSFPSSRRGSKDESLTTILVNSKGSPSRGSPSKPSDSSDALAGSAANRQSSHQTQKASAARNSVPSSRSHATSSATANTYQSPSTQPSSLAPTEDETQTRHQSLATADDPFAVPGKWPTSNPDATHRAHMQDSSLSVPPIPPIPVGAQSQRRDASPAARLGSGGSDGSGSRDSPRKNERLGGAIRESRSRSRLRGLKFWKKKRDASGDGAAGGSIPRSSPSSP